VFYLKDMPTGKRTRLLFFAPLTLTKLQKTFSPARLFLLTEIGRAKTLQRNYLCFVL
jgi:hypothetical protein